MTFTYPCPECGNDVELDEGDGSWQQRARAVGRHQRADQGLPEKLEDRAVIERLVTLVASRLR